MRTKSTQCTGADEDREGMPHRANALDNEPGKSIIYNVQFTIYNFRIKHRPECSTMFYDLSIAQKYVSLAMQPGKDKALYLTFS